MPLKTQTVWRAFTVRDRKRIEAQLDSAEASRCPRCNDILEARPIARGTFGFDLQCADCRRYYSRARFRDAQANPESLYLFRIQKLATAILRST